MSVRGIASNHRQIRSSNSLGFSRVLCAEVKTVADHFCSVNRIGGMMDDELPNSSFKS